VKALWEFQAYHGISVPRLRHRVELQKVMARHDMDTGKSTKTPRAPVEAVEPHLSNSDPRFLARTGLTDGRCFCLLLVMFSVRFCKIL
jgi:hypothetical protein